MIRSVLAAVVAVGLIVGAVYVRGAFLEDGGADPVADGSEAPDGDGELAVACDAALGDGCPEGADRRSLAELLTAFQVQPVVYDVLVAPTRVIELIEESRLSRAVLGQDRRPLAITPLVLATATRVQAEIDATCPMMTWSCAAGLLQDEVLTPAITDPTRTSTGLLAVGALTGGFLDDPGYSTNQLSGAGFFGWLDAVDQQVAVAGDPLNDLILFAGARNTAAVIVEAVAVDVAARTATNAPVLHWPTPVASLAVAAVSVDGTDGDRVAEVAEAASTALRAQGWRGPDGTPVPDGAPPLDPTADALPGGGTLFSLREQL